MKIELKISYSIIKNFTNRTTHHLSLFELGNLEYIAWTVGVGTGFLCFFVSVVVFTMWAKKEYSVRLAPGASFFFLAKRF